MANEQNLKPVRSVSEAREKGKKGGKASGEARRERKKLKDELLLMLENGDTQEKICIALIQQARRGNIKAFEVMRDTIGEKPVDMMSVDIPADAARTIAEIDEYLRGKGRK